jgi:bis(5'-nucleosidyl)-tetraphosphatase
MKKELSCGIVPLREGVKGTEVLLIFHRGGRNWAFPKGHKDPGETDLQTAERELHEETGLTPVSYLSMTPYEETYQFYKFQDKISKTVLYFPAFVEGKLKLQEEEIVDARWIPLVEAHRHLTFKESKEICQKVQVLLKDKK